MEQGQSINIYYDIQVSFEKNLLSSTADSPIIDELMQVTYGALHIGRFIQTKTFLHEHLPMAQLRLNSIPLDFIKEIESGNIFIVVEILQNNILLYKQYYTSFKVELLNWDESKELLPMNNVDCEIYMESVIIKMMKTDKILNSLQPDITDMSGYSTSYDVVSKKLQKLLIDRYGDAFTIQNFCEVNLATTAYKNITLPSKNSVIQNLNYLFEMFPFTLNPFMYGFDEGFVSNGTISELIIIDLLNYHSWYYLDAASNDFFNDPKYRNNSSISTRFIRNLYDEEFNRQWFHSKIYATNTINQENYEFTPIANTVYSGLTFSSSPLTSGVSINLDALKVPNINQVETSLSKSDFEKKIFALKEHYNRRPQIKQADFTGAPYETFRLGRRLPSVIDTGVNLSIGADITFAPIPNQNDLEQDKNILEKDNSFKCFGTLYYMNHSI